MFGEGEGGVEFDPEDPEGFRGVYGRDGGVARVNGDKVFFAYGRERRVRLARERTLPSLHRAPVMQHLLTSTVIHVYALKRESLLS
jgi:hypothetical protein